MYLYLLNNLRNGCDNANVLVGAKNGVDGIMKKKQPDLHLAGCPCHMLHNAAHKACTALPFNIDEVLVDTYYYLEKSSNCIAALEAFQEDVKHHKILKHVSTRWLSVRKCIDRVLENWDALKLFFNDETKGLKEGSKISLVSHSRVERL